jgi:hypothetical protein
MRKIAIICILLTCICATAHAAIVSQYASSVIDYSSQWGSSSWAAYQTLGAPDTFGYGDISTAWAPTPANGSLEYITLGFDTPVYASDVLIREIYGNGFVYQLDLLDTNDVLHSVWSGTDTSLPGAPVDALFSFGQTAYLVDGVKIYVDTNHDLSAWEEIDAVQLTGNTEGGAAAPVPEPATLFIFGSGMLGLFLRRK